MDIDFSDFSEKMHVSLIAMQNYKFLRACMCKKSPNCNKNQKKGGKKGDFDEFICIFDEFLLSL
jgi:hypothetical protein